MTGKRTLRVVLAALSLALLATGAAQGGGFRAHYIFRGHLLATPPANATSISLTVEGGNRKVARFELLFNQFKVVANEMYV